MTIPIYKAELDAGLGDMIKASTSIAYYAPIERFEPDETVRKKIIASVGDELKALASITDTDLIVNRSILVSVLWNKNDDVFDKEEVWFARHTPKHKPDNINHDDSLIVGHMLDVIPITAESEFKVIADNTTLDDLPDTYHLLSTSVIYNNRQDEKMAEMVAQLLADIDAGKKFVSMECMFKGFDYAIITPEGTSHVVARTKDTAWLTKHLRAYKGKGEYEGHKIGRLPRRITFSGKGYVDAPANPQSIILASENNFSFADVSLNNPFLNGSGVFINLEQKISANTNEKEIKSMGDEIKDDEVAKLKAANQELKDKLAAVGSEQLKVTLDEVTKKLEASVAEVASEKEKFTKAEAAKVEAETKLKEAVEAKAALETELSKLKAENTKANRVSTLVSGNLSKEEAEALVAKFAALDDEAFAGVAELAIKAAKPVEVKVEEVKPVVAPVKASLDGVLDDVEETETTITAGEVETDKDEEIGKIRAAMSSFISNSLNFKESK